MRRSHTPLVAPALSGGLVVALAAAVAAHPQDRHQHTFVTDGQAPMVFHSSMPDIRALITPDFVREDLPLFSGKLSLNELQRLVVETLLAAYLEQFDALVKEKLPGHGEGQMQDLGHDPDHDLMVGMHGPEGIDGIVREVLEGERPDDIDIDADFGTANRIAIAITAEDGPATGVFAPAGGEVVIAEASGGGEGEGPSASVVIAVGGPEGVELPEEVRRQLEEKAAEMVEQVRQRIEQNAAEGMDPLGGDMTPQEHIEFQKKRLAELAEQAKDFSRAKDALKHQFISDVQTQLASDQLQQWPSLDRALVRRKTLPMGRLDGERTDLLRLAERVRLADELDEIAEVLEAYEVELHQALVRRNEFLETANADIDKAMLAGKADDAIGIADRAASLRVAVRGVNERYADAIAQRLGEPKGPEFRSVAQKAFFPRVYGRTRAMRTFAEARELEALDGGVRTAIDQLETAYLQELGPINEQIRQTIETHQPKEPRLGLEDLRSMMEGTAGLTLFGHAGNDPIREAMQKRSALDEGYMKQLFALLPAEQIEKLPKLPSHRRAAPMFIVPN